MRRLSDLLSRLDLRPGEGRPVLLLITLSFCQGWALVMADTAAMTLFLSALGAGALPGIYIAAAVVVPLASACFGWLGQRLTSDRLALGALIALTSLLGLLWGASALGPWVFFLLLLWYRIFNALAGVIFWGLAGRLLNLRQAKRLYGIIGSGENVSRVLGYAAVPLLVGLIGVPNLLALAGAGLGGAVVAALALSRSAASMPTPQAPMSRRAAPASGIRALLTNRYTLLILSLIALANWAFSTLDLAFARQAQLRFSDTAELASLLASLSLALSVLRLIGRPLLTGRLIGRYGVGVGLLAQPLVLSFGALLLLAGSATGDPALLFWVVAAVRLSDGTFNTLLSRPALQILFQPLPETQRLTAQSAADGIVAPLALGLVGLSGLFLRDAPPALLALILLSLGVIWAAVARQVGGSYIRALSQSLLRRFGLGGAADLTDPAALAHVRQALASPHSGDVLYAIELLSQRMPTALEQARPALLAHPEPGVRRAVLDLIGAGQLPAELRELELLVAHEPDRRTRAAAIRALCAAAEADAIESVAPSINDPAPEICRSALVGLLRHGGIAGILAGGQRLLDLVGSAAPTDRILAAAIVGELGSVEFFQPLQRLFSDPDPAVRRAVLLAAGQIGSARLIPFQIAALADRGTAAVAASSLEQVGAAAAAALTAAFHTAALPEQVRIAAVLGRIGGDQAIGALRGAIGHPDAELRGVAYAGLSACGYRASRSERVRIRALIRSEAAHAAWILAASADLDAPGQLLTTALAADVTRCRERILHLLAITTDAQAVVAARTNLAQGTSERRAYAIEIIDVLLPSDLKLAVLPLFDDIAPGERLQRLLASFPQPRLPATERIQQIASAPDLAIGSWARACALTSALSGGVALVSRPDGADALIETVARVTALTRVPLFEATPGEILADIAPKLVAQHLPSRAPVFAQGELGHAMYIVAAGAVRISADGQQLRVMRAGDVFGEMEVLDPAARAASAEAIEPTELLRLDRADLDALFDERPEVARSLIGTLTRSLRMCVDQLAALRTQIDQARSAVQALDAVA
jgi:ATP:ADP antiporter, AAA family